MKLFLMAASLRKDSFNKKLVDLCANHLAGQNHEVNLRHFKEFDAPLYDGDIEESSGIPANVQKFAEHIKLADKIIFSVPEYNFSIPGGFKNLIDWVSRIKPGPLNGAQVLLISASPAMCGGHRGYLFTRLTLETGLTAFVYPKTFSLGEAHKMFEDDGSIKDKNLSDQLTKLIDEFVA